MSAAKQVECCVAGAGPAGMMAGLLLARAGVRTVVLEKHADFFRDFRGDTIHPSTLQLLAELGFLNDFLKLPHQELQHLEGQVGDEVIHLADFSHLPTACRFIALMPQWDFLNFLAEKAKAYPAFELMMQAEATDLLRENDRITGVRVRTATGLMEIQISLVIGADGRHSVIRERAGLPVVDLGAPMDVLWFRLSRRPQEIDMPLGRITLGRVFVMLNRDQYWQCALVIRKGGFDELHSAGLDVFRRTVTEAAPPLQDRVQEIQDWKQVSLLTVLVNRLTQWYKPGLLCIGDAAHAMSPIGGVGINLAIQDAIAAANLLAGPLRAKTLTTDDLAKVQARRTWPVVATQRMQLFIQNHVIRTVLGKPAPMRLSWYMKLFNVWPFLRRFPARLVGMGFRPEHVRSPNAP